jgi:hypothetical protein
MYIYIIFVSICHLAINKKLHPPIPVAPCDDNIVWRVSLVGGFHKTPIKFIFEGDTISHFNREGDWSHVSICALKYRDGFRVLISNQPNFTDTIYYDKIREDSLLMFIFTPDAQCVIDTRIVKYKYIGISFNNGLHEIYSFESDDCYYRNNFDASIAYCGDSVVWRIDFGMGFRDSTMTILAKEDTLFYFDRLKYSGKGKCDDLFIVIHKDEGLNKVHIDNWPYFNSDGELLNIELDTLDIEIRISDQRYFIKQSPAKKKFLFLEINETDDTLAQRWFDKCTIID